MMILGHRGIRQPEKPELPYQNSLEAISYAIDKGADGTELDVFVSSDGVCHVIHDDDTSLHGGGGLITAMDSSQISAVKINGGYRIPKLSDVLSLFKERDKFLNIEMKQHGIAEFVEKTVRVSGIKSEQVLISSFNHHDLMEMRELNKSLTIGLLFGRESKKNEIFEQYVTALAEKLAPSAYCMEKSLTYLSVLESRLQKYFWTITEDDVKNLRVEGLMMYENVNLITDYPEELINGLRAK